METQQLAIRQSKKSLPSRGMKSSTKQWILQKKERDMKLWGIDEQLWIIQNKVYDFTAFLDSHPGGKQWIQLTKGQDLTQHFIIHHLHQAKARSVLPKYYVKQVKNPQQPTFTFQSNGLYRNIKEALLKQYRPQELQNWHKSEIDGIILLLIWMVLFVASSIFESYGLAVLCGLSIYPLIGVAHNFVHMRFHPFRFLYALTGFTHKEWQEMHCISHHIYPNTLLDYEIQGLQPLVYYLKIQPKNKIINGIIKEIIFPFASILSIPARLVFMPLFNSTSPEWWCIIPLLQVPLLYVVNGDIWLSLKLFIIMQVSFSAFFMKINLIGHRTGRQWTEGNQEIRDFAEHQILTCTDTKTNNLCGFLSYVCFAGFNLHAAHHLFPTIDNHYLPQVDRVMRLQAAKIGIKKNQINSCLDGLYEVQSNFYNRKQWKRL